MSSSLEPFIQPPESEDDDPVIHPSLERYIHALPDSQTNYARFFSALLIPQQSHAQFFADLKQFREQANIVYLLAPGTSENYREVSRNFIRSRFAHPWCRVQSDFGKGWRGASWFGNSGGARVDERVRKEEDRLHKLLVPIWIAMRRRMFPGEEVVKEWVEKEEERARIAEEKKAAEAEKAKSQSPPSPPAYSELGFATKSTKTSTTTPGTADPEGVAAASKLFLGVAVTGFIMSDKRIQKYVEKKLFKK